MQFPLNTNSISLLSLMTILATTAPSTVTAAPTQRSSSTIITLIDATEHTYPVSIPPTKTWTPTNVIQSISHVRIDNESGFPCVFFGVDGVKILSFPGETGVYERDVGPPQTIVGGICGDFSHEED